MRNKFSDFISTAVMALYTVLFSGIFLGITFKNVIFTYRISVQLSIIAVLLIILMASLFIYKKACPILIKHRYKLLAAFCIFMFIIQTIISLNMVPNVMYDHEKTLNAAIVWTLEGNSEKFQLYNNYLHHYPHQMGIFLIQQAVFSVCNAFGFTNFFITACILGHLLFMVMHFASFKYLDENYSAHRAIFYLLLAAIYVPMYLQSSVSYTDTYSVWAAPCLLLFGTRAFKTDKTAYRIFYSALSGVLAGLALQIKTTAVFILLAMIIQLITTSIRKHQLAAVGIILAALFLTNTAFNKMSYATVLEEYRDGESMPVTHWIMMGLQGDGSYNGYDEWEITCSVPPDERMALNIKVIGERLTEMGPKGYLKLLYTKTCRTFGSGNADLRYSFKYEEEYNPSSLLYNFVFENGRFYGITNNLSNSVYLLINLLGICGGAIILVKNRERAKNFAPHLGLAGFWVFMMLWESSHRQLINQWGLYFIVASIGLCEIYSLIFNKE